MNYDVADGQTIAIFRMKAHFVAMIVLALMAEGWGGRVRAADEGSTSPNVEQMANDLAPSEDSLISREDWKRRIGEARSRAERARLDWRLNAPLRMVAPDSPEKIATARVLSDDTLQPGDIVSTDKGFFLFRGRSGPGGQAADLVPVVPR